MASSSHPGIHEEIYRRLHDLDQKLQYVERREQEGLRAAQQQLAQLQETCRGADVVVANLEVKLSKDIQFIEESLARDVQLEAQRRSDTETKLRQLVQEEAAAARALLEADNRARNAELDGKLREMTANLVTLCNGLEDKLRALTSRVDDAVAAAEADAAAVEKQLAAHRSTREAAEMNILQVLEETCLQIHQEIVQERQERTESHKRLERLLLEASTRQWVRT